MMNQCIILPKADATPEVHSKTSIHTMDSVPKPHENDILLGRGGNNNKHIGNEKLRALARSQVERYRSSTKKDKSKISRELVFYVRSMSPPGRFLKRNAFNEQWEDVGDDVAREKTSQALRDAVSVHGEINSTATVDHSPLPPVPSAQHPAQQRAPVIDPYFLSRMQACSNGPMHGVSHFSNENKFRGEFHSNANHSNNVGNQAVSVNGTSYPCFKKIVQRTSPQVKNPPSNSNALLPVVSPDDPENWKERYGDTTVQTSIHKRFDQGQFDPNQQQRIYDHQQRFHHHNQQSYWKQHNMTQHTEMLRAFEDRDHQNLECNDEGNNSFDLGGRRNKHQSSSGHHQSSRHCHESDQMEDLDLMNFDWLPQGDTEFPAWNNYAS